MTFPTGWSGRVEIRQTETAIDGEMKGLELADVQHALVVVDVLRAQSQMGEIASVAMQWMMMMMMGGVCSCGTGRRHGNIVMLMVQWIVEDHLSCVVCRVGRKTVSTTCVSAWLARISRRRGGGGGCRSYGLVHV